MRAVTLVTPRDAVRVLKDLSKLSRKTGRPSGT